VPFARPPKPMIHARDILRSPIRSFRFLKREADWLRHFAATMEHRRVAAMPPSTAEATERLYERLDAGDVAAIEARLSGEDAQLWAETVPDDRKRLALAFGLHHDVPGVAEKTGLLALAPPDEVHAMARGSVATGGSYYYADIVADALRGAGAPLERGRVLDFGCSSGRVIRVLCAAYPELECYGCDPQPAPIEWAREHLSGIDFCVSPESPPLPHEDGFFDAVFAISIWSHYGERAAREWLAEMHRVIKPGGHLLLTFRLLRRPRRSHPQGEPAARTRALARRLLVPRPVRRRRGRPRHPQQRVGNHVHHRRVAAQRSAPAVVRRRLRPRPGRGQPGSPGPQAPLRR
jgi:SAM-dependent methyltransferase